MEHLRSRCSPLPSAVLTAHRAQPTAILPPRSSARPQRARALDSAQGHWPFTQGKPLQHWLAALHMLPFGVQLLPQVSVSGRQLKPAQHDSAVPHGWPCPLHVAVPQMPFVHESGAQHAWFGPHA
jgi:hypothetical protein